MQDDAKFDRQGEGYNALPHLLTATLDPDWRDGMRWSVQCPYEGAGRPCALLEECTKHPRPQSPGVGCTPMDPEFQQRWDEWEAADERWWEDHDFGSWHPANQCWASHMIAEGDYEPEYYLRSMPKGHVINGPLRIQIGRIGNYEEAEPVFRLWDDNESGEQR